MLIPLLLGCATVFITMSVQIAAVVYMLQYLFNTLTRAEDELFDRRRASYVISLIMTMLFIGHVIQVAIWAVLFRRLGEFTDFQTAFYHSMVNFASLGYGDIVMSEKWRLLGAIEASTGVLMFGLSAGTMLTVMNRILSQSPHLKDQFATLNQKDQNR